MKKVVFALIASIILASCGASRNMTKDKTERAIDSTGTTITRVDSTTKVVDTTRTTTGEIIITEIEFYNPDMADADSSGHPCVADLQLHGIGNVKGAVKRIKQTQVKKKDERRGESKETNVSNESKSNAAVKRRDTMQHQEATVAKDPYRWRYIAFILAVVVAAVVLLYIKRQPILRIVGKFIASIRRFLK